ncbi:MAG TPA: ABC transporter permease [Gemmatimonadales bacterium]|nr:ABC transporter permease [Gemmatimonadales bacterium]
MALWLVRRIAASAAIVVAVVTTMFLLLHLAPGVPFLPGVETPMDPAVVARLRAEFGLDQPLPVQYAKYVAALARGNFGESFALHRPVADALADAIPNTLVLAGTALLLDLVLGLALGVYQAVRTHRLPDIALGYGTLFLGSVPTFWLGLLSLLVFGEGLHWFPIGGVVDPVLYPTLPLGARIVDRLWHLTLPALTLGCVGAASTARYERAAVLEVLAQDYIRTARAKGLPERLVILRHALRNAVLPLVTLFGLSLPFLLTGAVLVESVFAWPGMGKLAADAIFRRDYPVVLAATLGATVMVVLGNLVADLLYAVVDPRIRVHRA